MRNSDTRHPAHPTVDSVFAAIADWVGKFRRYAGAICSACACPAATRAPDQHELAVGEATARFHEFCPNAYRLDALLKRESLPF